MHTSKLLIYFLCLIIVFGNVTPTLAVREEKDSADLRKGELLTEKLAEADVLERAQIWEKLSKEDKDAVVIYNTVVQITSEDIYQQHISACDVRGRKEKGYNYFGQVLWEYYSKVEWCYNGTTVTSKFATRTGKPGPFPSLWEYMGDAVPPVESGGVGQTYYRIWVNGYFRFAVAGYPIQTAYPWIDITVRGNGTSTATSGQ